MQDFVHQPYSALHRNLLKESVFQILPVLCKGDVCWDIARSRERTTVLQGPK